MIITADQISTRPGLFFYKNVILLLKNMVKYHYEPKNEYLKICQIAIENFSLLGMNEYGKELNQFFEQQK